MVRAQILGRKTPGLTRGSPSFYIANAGEEPRVKPGVWHPEICARGPSSGRGRGPGWEFGLRCGHSSNVASPP
jgi:hypothetical protein